jgi:hypothetical protein
VKVRLVAQPGVNNGHTENEIILRNLSVADLLRERVCSVVEIGKEPNRLEPLADLRRVVFLYTESHQTLFLESADSTHVRDGNRYHNDLAR